MASVIMSLGFIVSFRLFEMLCMVTTFRPLVPVPFELSGLTYVVCGKAIRRAIDAKNISIQMMKFCQPAATEPALKLYELEPVSTAWIIPITSNKASNTPCQKVKKITDLMVKNLMTGL